MLHEEKPVTLGYPNKNVLLYARPEPEQEVRPPPYPSLVL